MGLRVLNEPHDVVADGLHAGDADTAAVLGGEGVVIDPLDITVLGKGDDDVLLWDEVLVFDIGGRIGNLRTSPIAKARFDFLKLDDHLIDDVVPGGKETVVFGDVRFKIALFGVEFVLFHTLQTTEGHRKDRVALRLGQSESPVQAERGFLIVFRVTDDVNDFVDVIVSKDQAFDDVEAIGVFLKEEFGPSGNNGDLEFNVVLKERDDAQGLWGPIFKAEVDDTEITLKGGMLKQIVRDDFGNGVFPDVDYDTDLAF